MNIQLRICLSMGLLVSVLTVGVSTALAHAVVKPNTAGIGAFTDFSLGVPAEKPVATTAVKLVIPAGLNYVSPIVKPGWKIEVKQSADPSGKKDDDGNPAMITSEIDWTGGEIPAEQKDLFQFSAQVPSTEGELDWKVEQTYADGSVVSWSLGPNDQQPKDEKGNTDFSKFGPYSKTMVVNDLTGSNQTSTSQTMMGSTSTQSKLPFIFSVVAIALSALSLLMQYQARKK